MRIAWIDAYLVNLVSNGFLRAIIQVLESYFLLYRYLAVSNPPRWFTVLTQIYIWALLVLPYFLFYTIAPFIVDVNSDKPKKAFSTSIFVYLGAQLLYNLFLGLLFYQQLVRAIAKGGTTMVDIKLRWVSAKLVIQCLIR